MQLHRLISRALPLAAIALVGTAPIAFAQGQELFEWNGRVDREIQLTMRGRQVWTNLIGNTEPGRGHVRLLGSLPYNTNTQVSVQVQQGRGYVDVIQQPSAANGYTTVIRIQDPSAGASEYRIAAFANNYSNGEYVGNGNRGRGRGHGRGQVNRSRDRDNDCDEDDRCGSTNGSNGQYGQNGQYGTNGQYGRYGQYGNQMLHWSGSVDDDLEIRIQNGNVSYRTISGRQPASIRVDQGNFSMPSSGATVAVVQNQGRGSVTVVQQPSRWNGYTTVLRVRDPQGGYGYYDFNLVWQ